MFQDSNGEVRRASAGPPRTRPLAVRVQPCPVARCLPSYGGRHGARRASSSWRGLRHRSAAAPVGHLPEHPSRRRTPSWSPPVVGELVRAHAVLEAASAAVPALGPRLAPSRRPTPSTSTCWSARCRRPTCRPPLLRGVAAAPRRRWRRSGGPSSGCCARCAPAASAPRAATWLACWRASPPRPRSTPPPWRRERAMTVLDALQATLGDEHAALYTYGVLGARISQSATPALYDAITAAYRRHRARRDQLRVLVEEAGGEPVAAAAAYGLGRAAAPRPPGAGGGARHRGVERRGADRPGRPVGRRRARVGTRRGDLVGHVAVELGGVAQTWPGARPSSIRFRQDSADSSPNSGNRQRPAASAFGKNPRSLPKAEDADRLDGVGQHHPVWPLLWGWRNHMHNHAFHFHVRVTKTCLQVLATHKVAAAPARTDPLSRPTHRRPRTARRTGCGRAR